VVRASSAVDWGACGASPLGIFASSCVCPVFVVRVSGGRSFVVFVIALLPCRRIGSPRSYTRRCTRRAPPPSETLVRSPRRGRRAGVWFRGCRVAPVSRQCIAVPLRDAGPRWTSSPSGSRRGPVLGWSDTQGGCIHIIVSTLHTMSSHSTLHPAGPCTAHPAPCTLHAVRCTQHAARCTLHPARCTLHAAPSTLRAAPCTLPTAHCAHCAQRAAHIMTYCGASCTNFRPMKKI
jgi:hypothetical protein